MNIARSESCFILTSAANILSRLKSTLGFTVASLIDKNYSKETGNKNKIAARKSKAGINSTRYRS